MEGKKGTLKTKKIVINTPFVQERSSTRREDMLHTIDGPMQLVHADVTDLNFFSKSAVAPKYCLLCVNMFTSKTSIYSMKRKSQMAEKLEKFLLETQELRKYLIKDGRGKICLQTNQEFNQNEIKEIAKK